MPRKKARHSSYKRKWKGPSTEPDPCPDKESATMSVCGLLCNGEEGVPPQLQCERCLSLYHPGCVGQPVDTLSFLCNKCVLGTLEIKIEPVEMTDEQFWSTEPCELTEGSVVIKKEPEDGESGWFDSLQGCGQSVVIKQEPGDSTDDTEWQSNISTTFLWNNDQVFGEEVGEMLPKRTKLSTSSPSHIFPLPAAFARSIDQHLPLTISIKGVNIKVPPFGHMEFVRPEADFQVVLNPGVMDTLDRTCSYEDNNCYSFIASYNPSDPQNIILQDLASQKSNDSDLEGKSFCTTVISAFGEEETYLPMRICHNCLFMYKKADGKMTGGTVMSFTCFSCMALRSSIITEDFSEPQHVPKDPRSRHILEAIDAQETEIARAFDYHNDASETSGKDIKFAQRGHLIRLPNRLLDRTRLTQPLLLTINGVRVRVPPNGKVLLSKQYGAQVFIPEEIVNSVGVKSPENKSFIIMTSPSDAQNLVVQETGSKTQTKPTPSYHSGFFQTEITAALDFESAYKMVFNKEPPPPPPVLITDSGELHPETPAPSNIASTRDGCKSSPVFCPFQSLYGGYVLFLKIMGYLTIKDRLRARLVCKTWKEMFMHYSMWQEISLFDHVVTDWQVAAAFMSQVNTRSLDLRGLVHCHGDDNRTWHQFLSSLGRLCHLEDIEFEKCPAIVLMTAAGKLFNLRSLSAMQLTGPGSSGNVWNVTTKIDVTKLENLVELEILQLRGVCALLLTDGLLGISKLSHLQILSLTTLRNLSDQEMETIGNLTTIEVLELGDCDNISNAGIDQLRKLKNIARLRLEYRPNSENAHLADVLVSLDSLSSLELVKFVLCDKLLETLENLEQLLSLVLWPETAEKEAEDNTAVLQTLSKMTFLDHLEWGITSSKVDDSAQTALFLEDDVNNSRNKSSLLTRSKTVTISKVMNDLCSNLTETKIKVFKLKMPQVKSKTQTSLGSPTKAGLNATHSASLRYVLNFLKSKLKPERSVGASRRALRH